MTKRTQAFQAWFNAWLLRVGLVRVVLAITGVSALLSVLMTWFGNAVFMPDVPIEEWLYISLIVPVLISPPISALVLSLLYQLAEARAALATMAETDPLTGAGNRRHFFRCAQLALAEAAKASTPITVILIDIDHFKMLNDRYGHAVGDKALVSVSSTCRQALRVGDVFCRWGGEEFIILLPNSSLAVGVALAERLRVAVMETRVEGVEGRVTVSCGVAEIANAAETLDQVIGQADAQLYLAKEAGRNQVSPSVPEDQLLAAYPEVERLTKFAG
jgi:diguanylate cyclase (GGDEF)-like protein